MNTQTLAIDGMHCQACVTRLTQALTTIPGIASAQVSLTPPQATIHSAIPIPLATLQSAASAAGHYRVRESGLPLAALSTPAAIDAPKNPSLYPLFLIIAFITGTVILIALQRHAWDTHAAMLDFMAAFFLVFSFFKLLDLPNFATAYQSYDLLANRSRLYALLYPFLELALGVAYLTRWQLTITNTATLTLMVVSSLGVIQAVASKRQIRCACLGTALNLPMTTVTIIEDIGMAAMAGGMLLWR